MEQHALTRVEKETIGAEIKNQFKSLVSALNRLNAAEWSDHYSRNDFVSAIVATDYYASRPEWVNLITNYFSMRDRQHVLPRDVRVTALSPDLALMTSEETGEMWLKDGSRITSKHVFTMIWQKEKTGWKILHSHESWCDE